MNETVNRSERTTETHTVNKDEVARYDALAATWWQSDGPMWPLHKLNALRAPYVRQEIYRHLASDSAMLLPQPNRSRKTEDRLPAPSLAGIKVLDIGCGAGLLSEAMAERGASVVGIDPAARNIDIARAHAAEAGLEIDYRYGTVDVLTAREQFDVVLNMEVVEHVENLPEFVTQCCARVRPGGLHFVATINRNPLSWLVAIVGAEYVLRWLPKGTHEWRKFVTPAEATQLLADNGHRVRTRTGVSVNPLTKSFRCTDFTGVNYMLTARRER